MESKGGAAKTKSITMGKQKNMKWTGQFIAYSAKKQQQHKANYLQGLKKNKILSSSLIVLFNPQFLGCSYDESAKTLYPDSAELLVHQHCFGQKCLGFKNGTGAKFIARFQR